MSIRFLLDTNIISETLRPKPNAKIVAQFQQHQDELAIPAIVWHELWFGAQRLPPSARRETIEQYLMQVIAPLIPILPYDGPAAEWHAAERARLSSLGKTPPFADGQIAAIATVNELTLVTLKLSDYSAFEGLRITDWQ